MSSTPISPLFLLQLWDTVRGQLASHYTHPKSLNCIAFHPEGQVVATGTWAGSITFFQADGLKVTKVIRSCVTLQENTQDLWRTTATIHVALSPY